MPRKTMERLVPHSPLCQGPPLDLSLDLSLDLNLDLTWSSTLRHTKLAGPFAVQVGSNERACSTGACGVRRVTALSVEHQLLDDHLAARGLTMLKRTTPTSVQVWAHMVVGFGGVTPTLGDLSNRGSSQEPWQEVLLWAVANGTERVCLAR